MQQIPTNEELSPAQLQALEVLLSGQTITEAAKAANVNRTTVHKWQRESFVFQAAYNRSRQEIVSAMHARVLRLASRAVQIVEEAVDAGNVRAAMQIVENLGLIQPAYLTTGPDDPERLRQNAEMAKRQEGMTMAIW